MVRSIIRVRSSARLPNAQEPEFPTWWVEGRRGFWLMEGGPLVVAGVTVGEGIAPGVGGRAADGLAAVSEQTLPGGVTVAGDGECEVSPGRWMPMALDVARW
jgi:hypothetical protein